MVTRWFISLPQLPTKLHPTPCPSAPAYKFWNLEIMKALWKHLFTTVLFYCYPLKLRLLKEKAQNYYLTLYFWRQKVDLFWWGIGVCSTRFSKGKLISKSFAHYDWKNLTKQRKKWTKTDVSKTNGQVF